MSLVDVGTTKTQALFDGQIIIYCEYNYSGTAIISNGSESEQQFRIDMCVIACLHEQL